MAERAKNRCPLCGQVLAGSLRVKLADAEEQLRRWVRQETDAEVRRELKRKAAAARKSDGTARAPAQPSRGARPKRKPKPGAKTPPDVTSEIAEYL